MYANRIAKKQTTDLHNYTSYVWALTKMGANTSSHENQDGSWVGTFTPICGGHHTIQFNKPNVQSVTSIPKIRARARQGPD